jgi:hypothetical protein
MINIPLFDKIALEFDLDDREKLILAYRVGAKGRIATMQELADFLTQSSQPMKRQRVDQIEKAIRKKIGETNWLKLRGEYVGNRPTPVSKTAKARNMARLRAYFREITPDVPIQYGRILDELEIPFDKTDDPYVLDEEESCKKFFELFELQNFGKLRYCARCGRVLPVDDFYRVAGTERHYSTCKECNTARCAEYTSANREKVAKTRSEWKKRRAMGASASK